MDFVVSDDCTELGVHLWDNSSILHSVLFFFVFFIADRREGIGVCGWILVSLSFFLVLVTFAISIWACIKVS